MVRPKGFWFKEIEKIFDNYKSLHFITISTN